MNGWVVNLDDAVAGHIDRVGGKAAQLHRMLQAGLPVPDAVVITADAFRSHFGDMPLDERPATPTLDRALQIDIREVLEATFKADEFLVVRSSSTSEDGADYSFAGQHETYYYIARDQVMPAVAACWLSMWSPAALSYRAEQTEPADPGAMAVIVQRMVQADRSGVCFTADPTGTHPDDVWIEAIWGLGAALVDGRVSPDRLRLDRNGSILRHQIGRKRFKVAAALRDPADLRLEPVPAFQQSQPALDASRAAEVLDMSLEAERLAGCPQDVEWAYEAERLYLLQSRPITAAETGLASADPPAGRWVLFKPLAENFTDPLTPMTADLFRRVLPPVGRFIDGRYYLNLSLAEQHSPFQWSTAELVDVMLLRGEVPKLNLKYWKLPLALVGAGAAYLLDGIAWHRSARMTREGLSRYADICQALRDDAGTDTLSALQRLVVGERPLEPMGMRAFYLNVSAGRYFLLLGLLNAFVRRFAPDFDRDLISQLCSGDGETFSRQLVESIRELAAVAADDVDLARQLESGDPNLLADTLSALPDDHPFVTALRDFLDRFGHRCSREMELAVPRWREDPVPVLLMVRGYLAATPAEPSDPRSMRRLARDSLRRALPRLWQRWLADYLIERVRYYVSLREDTRHYHAMAMDVARGKLLDLEQRLISEGRLRVAGDVFFLNWDEAQQLSRRRLAWRDVSERIRYRRRNRRRAAAAGARDTLGVDVPARPADAGRAVTSLSGQCASPGWAEGSVRIVLDPATAHGIRPGDILVAPFTDPAWTPLFPLVSAVVVEVGSFLSHAGTLAREYGIPCLVDVDGCTERLREGQRVRVLASAGRLEVCES